MARHGLQVDGYPMSTVHADLAAAFNSVLGEGTVRLGNDPQFRTRFWPTGVLPIDYLLNGGLPAGRFIEVYGDYSTLKSMVAYHALGNVQRMGGKVALVDTEHAYDADWAEALGVDTDALLVERPETAEDSIKIMEAHIRDDYDLLVWDSIASSQPKQYRDAAPGEDLAPAGLARVMSNGLRRLNAGNKRTAVLCLNQTRINVGMTYGGSKESVPGGRAMPFFASYRVRLTRAGKVTEDTKVHDGEKLVGAKRVLAHKIKASLEKSKLSAPYAETWFLFDLSTGSVDVPGFLLSQGIERGLINEGVGGRFTIPGVLDKSVHGKPKFKQFMQDNPEVIDWLTSEVMGTPSLASPGVTEPAKKKASRPKQPS
jgi:recombination protein RecA